MLSWNYTWNLKKTKHFCCQMLMQKWKCDMHSWLVVDMHCSLQYKCSFHFVSAALRIRACSVVIELPKCSDAVHSSVWSAGNIRRDGKYQSCCSYPRADPCTCSVNVVTAFNEFDYSQHERNVNVPLRQHRCNTHLTYLVCPVMF